MKKILTSAFTIVALLALVPQLALAAWWQPSTWFDFFFKKFQSEPAVVKQVEVQVPPVERNAPALNTGATATSTGTTSFRDMMGSSAASSPSRPAQTPSASAAKQPPSPHKNMPTVSGVTDTGNGQAENQFVSGSTIIVSGSNFGDGSDYYSGKVYFDTQAVVFTGAARNAIRVTAPRLSTGTHKLYVVGSDGLKSNVIEVYVVSATATSKIQPSVTLKINGSEKPAAVPYNSLLNVSWTSANVSTYCTPSGTNAPRKDGGLWTDMYGSKRTGSDQVYARGKDGAYVSQIHLTMTCEVGELDSITGTVDVDVMPPTVSNPLITQVAISNISNFTKTVITEVKSDSGLALGEMFQGNKVTIKGKNFKSTSPNRVFIGNTEVDIVGGGPDMIIFIAPVTVPAGTYDLYVTNEGGASNSIKVKVVSTGLDERPIDIQGIRNNTNPSLPQNQFKAGDSVTIKGQDFPLTGSIIITGASQPNELGMGFFMEYNPAGYAEIKTSMPSTYPPGQYNLKINGSDKRTSASLSIVIIN